MSDKTREKQKMQEKKKEEEGKEQEEEQPSNRTANCINMFPVCPTRATLRKWVEVGTVEWSKGEGGREVGAFEICCINMPINFLSGFGEQLN